MRHGGIRGKQVREGNSEAQVSASKDLGRELGVCGIGDGQTLGEPAEGEGMSEWQPIETAPKDGTEIIACQSGTPEVGLILWDADEACWLEPADEWSGPNWLPTHWMPLPPSPKEQP